MRNTLYVINYCHKTLDVSISVKLPSGNLDKKDCSNLDMNNFCKLEPNLSKKYGDGGPYGIFASGIRIFAISEDKKSVWGRVKKLKSGAIENIPILKDNLSRRSDGAYFVELTCL